MFLGLHLAVGAQNFMKVTSYNIWDGFDNKPERRQAFVDWVRADSSDIVMTMELVGFKADDLAKLGADCGYPYTAILKEEWYPVGVMSKTPIEVVNRFVTPTEEFFVTKRGLWHGLLHARTGGLDLLITHLSPFDYEFRRQEADFIINYADSLALKDYLVAGDLNSISPYDADYMAPKGYLKRLKSGDRKRQQQGWHNVTSTGSFDTSVISQFLASGLSDPVWVYEKDLEKRMSFPSAFSRGKAPDDPSMKDLRVRIDYILLSPSLMNRCVSARITPVEGVSDHYPVQLLLTRNDYRNPALPAEVRAADLLSRMTLDEKIAQIRHIHHSNIYDGQQLNPGKMHGFLGDVAWGFVEGFPLTAENFRTGMRQVQKYMVDSTRLGIPAFIVAESLHGSVHEGTAIFPQNIALASTFNPALAYDRARGASADLHYQGVNQILAPCIDVVRDMRWGRVEETYGEDPWLNATFACAEVKGYLDSGISPMLKHFGAHGNPTGGLNLASVHCGLGELHEVYLYPFKRVLTTLPVEAVMSSYNSWNREPNSASRYLLTDVLRGQWGFKGYVYSDWGAIEMLNTFHHSAPSKAAAAVDALTAGLDAEASSECYPHLARLVRSGKIDEAVIDTAVMRVLEAKFRLGLFEDPYGERYSKGASLRSPESVALSRAIADEATVLLKNDGDLLPLDPSKLGSIAVIGPNADQVQFGDYTWSRNNADGVTPLAGIRNALAGRGTDIRYARGCSLMSMDTTGIAEAVDAARLSDVAVIFCGSASASLARDYSGSNCGEGFDLTDLNLTGAQPELIKAVQATGTPVVLVLVTGKPFTIAWEKENIPAILVQWYSGEKEGDAIAAVLFGKVNPSGHLPVSFPQSVGHQPAHYNHLPTDHGYYRSPGTYERPGRDYVFSNPEPLWAFGHGLSYTTFGLSGLTVEQTPDSVRVNVTVTNTGKRAGKAVPQLYVRDRVSTVATPVRQLRAFDKVLLEPGESRVVVLDFAIDDLAVTDNRGKRAVEPGEFEIQVGEASDRIALTSVITVGDYDPLLDTDSAEAEQPAYKGTGRKMSVTGIVRDVQATPLAGVTVWSAKQNKDVGRTAADGSYKVKVADDDRLVFRLKGYKEQTEQVRGRSDIGVRIAK